MYGIMRGKRMRQLQAFSLIELMVVIAIVATLSTVAVPAYREYTLRAKVSGASGIADTVKNDVVTELSMGTIYGTSTSTKIASGASNKPQYVNQMIREAYGCVSIYFDLAQLGLSGGALVLKQCPGLNTTTGAITWNCGHNGDATHMAYLPSNCRQAATEDTNL